LYKPREIGEGEKFPGIVWIHGGYKGGGNWQFDDSFLQQRNSSKQSVQFMVQYGYVVLQPNTRGSTGYGREFEKANNGRWGENELKDILAGVEYLKSLPHLDKKNIGITGRSYGGTMTMVAISKAPGVFQAAVAEAGLSDWARGIQNDYPIDTMKMFEYEIGPLVGNENLYRELSPITNVENIKTPVFIVQGIGASPGALGFAKSHGFVVLPDSKLFAKSLLRHFKVFEYKEYPSSGYYVSSYESRHQFFVDRLDFFERFLKGKVAIN
jgi:dipeptidyl aminopeptidase/acylaminoacyl peptidase